MAEYVIEGPKGAWPGSPTNFVTNTPEFALNTRIKTLDENNKVRIYRYLKTHAAATAGTIYVCGSFGEILSSAIMSNALGRPLVVPQVAITSNAGGAVYGFAQTGGVFDTTGILTNSCVANSQLYLTTASGTASSTPGATAPVKLQGAYATTTGSSSAVAAYSPDELIAITNLLA